MTSSEFLDIIGNTNCCLWFGKPPCPHCKGDHGDPKCTNDFDKELRELVMDFDRAKGYSYKRVETNPLEHVFAKAWQKVVEGKTLNYLLDPEHPNYPDSPSDRDYKVAATVIQWLGSPVGQGFLKEILETQEGKDFYLY